ncbi:type III-A CRISPR-associated RAMP protein Csm3 [Bacillus sp. 3103sda1]|uniref:type III-A CRISPR-associated RAMP protein Csm3 n=1 Tax=Bacillus sp. 3103sda1 TaxID=2953808 RepID=UPI00209EBD7F|nr:type III-A CRISPR-associated RAMP protein Csm3 [Bacillus sp. 3103sda1]MCP1123841.1 type III-A CRISPR-associated RAMP protein Csm3 [Bacillus sp. 3103sda1]
MKVVKIIEITGIIKCETGLRIGGSKDSIEIGGLDNPIIRQPLTDLPYIPGSSVKGKLRSLLEGVYGRKPKSSHPRAAGEPCGCAHETCLVCRVFGPHKNSHHKLGPTRLLVRDFKLTNESRESLQHANASKGMFYTEIKTENIIVRTTGTADKPRTFERVPEGAEFDLKMVLKIYDKDNQEQVINFIKQGLKLLESDYLGGSGSRGYGQVSFKNLEFIPHDVNEKIDFIKEVGSK